MRRLYACSFNLTSTNCYWPLLWTCSVYFFPLSPFHPLLLVSPVSEFISPFDLLKVVQFLVERTLSPSFLSARLPAIWPSNRKPFSTELLLRNRVERFHLNITRILELSQSIHSEFPRKSTEKPSWTHCIWNVCLKFFISLSVVIFPVQFWFCVCHAQTLKQFL